MGEIHLIRAAAYDEDALKNSNVKELYELELDQAIAKANIALKMIPHLHAESVKPLCVLLKAYFLKPKEQDMALEYFDLAISTLEFHVGPYHPLHASINILNKRSLFNNVSLLFQEKEISRLSDTPKICFALLYSNVG